VTVTGRAAAEVVPARVLSGEALQRLNSHSVADALRYFSGVTIKDYGGIGGLKTVNVRDMGTHHVGVFLDGIQIGNAQNGVVDLGRFSLENMEAVALYNGQKSAIFQPASHFASASAIYMQARRPAFDGNARDRFKATLAGGSFKTVNPSVLWERRVGESAAASVNVEYMHTSGEYAFRYTKKEGYDTTETRANGDVRLIRVEAACFDEWPGGGEWRARLYFYDSARGYPGAAVKGIFSHEDRQWDTNLFLQSSFRRRFSPRYSLAGSGKYAYDYLHYLSDPRLDVTTMYVNNRYRQQEAYLSSSHLFSLTGAWSASLACDARWNRLESDVTSFPRRYSVLTAAATSLALDRLAIQGSLLHTLVRDRGGEEGVAASRTSAFTPALVASYRPLDGLTLRAFYKRVFRMPTFNDLYYTFIGNKNLRPEYATQYSAGFTFTRGGARRVTVQVDLYHNEVEDKIIAMPTSNQFRWTMINLGYVEIDGAEVTARGEWQAGALAVGTRLSYAYQRARDLTNPDSPFHGDQIPYSPRHSGSLVLTGDYRGWAINYSFIYTGERYEQAANIPENHMLPWYTHDLSLSRSLAFSKARARLTAGVNNLFNQQYEVVQCYPMPGTNVKLSASIEW
jgi:outer membrane cobalamin receptor